MNNPKPPKRPRNVNQLAKAIADLATGEDPAPAVQPEAEPAKPEKLAAAVELGRRGGLKGGAARAAKLTAQQRSEIAKKAAMKRWGKSTD